MTAITTTLLPYLTLLSLILGIVSTFYSWYRTREQAEDKLLTNAIETALKDYDLTAQIGLKERQEICREEVNEVTQDLSDRVKELEIKIDLFWRIVEKEFPRLLKQETTPNLDLILNIAENGYDCLTQEMAKDLYMRLKEEYRIALQHERPCRGYLLVMYMGGLSTAFGFELPVEILPKEK